jgi:hypothetical protein
MAGNRVLRPADELIGPALARTVAAYDPPDSDAGLVRLAEVTAAAIDAMPAGVRATMLGQTAPLLLKLLVELDARAQRRQQPAKGAPNRLQQLRAARAAVDARRT